VTELQCEGHSAACEAAHCVQVLKDRGQCGREGGYMRMDRTSSTRGGKLNKNG